MLYRSLSLLLFLCFFAVCAMASHVQTDYKIPSINATIDVDGQLSENAWKRAKKVELLYENEPGENSPARVKTTAYYFEDGENLYVGFEAFDPDISQLRAFYNDRDASWNDDQVSIMLDTFNAERRAYQFFVNPLGVQSDSFINEVNSSQDISWNGIWDSAGHINDSGYTVEMVIPLRILRFNEGLDHQIWGIEFIRFYPRDNRYRLSSMTRERGSPCELCQLEKVEGVSEIKGSNNFDIVPTLTLSKNEQRDLGETRQWSSDGLESEFGADIRWGINQDIYLNATINPDFSQVETDAAQLSVNQQFSLFFPEKRTFFLDGADYFQSPNRLVHTRNIADPDFGAKVTGKTNSHSYGLIVADDTQTSFLEPGNQGSSIRELEGEESHIAIGRWTKDIGTKHSIGALVTHRSATDYKNQVMAADGRFWLSDNDWVQFQLMHSDSETPENDDVQVQQGSAYTLSYRHKERDWEWRVEHMDFDKDFRADLGFIRQVDFSKSAAGIGRNWYFEKSNFLNRIRLSSDYDVTHAQDGQKLEEEVEGWINFHGAMQFRAFFGGGRRERLVENSFELERLDDPQAPTPIPSGEFDAFQLSEYFYESFYAAGIFIRPVAELRLGIRGDFGDQVDVHNVQLGTRHSFGPEVEWLPNRNMRLSVRHVNNWLDVDDGELFNAKLTDLRFSYQFDLRHRLKLSYQYLDLTQDPILYQERYRIVPDLSLYQLSERNRRVKDVSTQLIYSYKVNPQSLVFLGYSSHGQLDQTSTRVQQDQRSFFAKFSYAFQM